MYVRDTPVVSVLRQSDTPVVSVLRYARIPETVGSDPQLRSQDVRVYYALALAERNGLAIIGQRAIATSARMSQPHVASAIGRLESAGHIRVDRRIRARAGYTLMAPMFAAQQAISPPAATVQVIAMRKCPRCNRAVRQVLKAGWCRTCAWTDRVASVARRVVAERPQPLAVCAAKWT